MTTFSNGGASAPGASRMALVALMGSVFISLMGVGFVVPFLPVLATELGASATMLGVLTAAFSLSMGGLQPLAGSLSDRHGRKRFLLAGLGIFTVCGFAYTLASSVLDITVVRFVQGLGAGMIFPVAMAYMGDLAPPEHEGRYMGIFNVALLSGIGSGPLLGGVLKDNFGMDAAFYAMGVLSAAALVLTLAALPESRPIREGGEPEAPLMTVFRTIFADRRMRGVLLVRLSIMLAMVPSFVFLPVLMTDVMGASGTMIGVVITLRTLLSAALQYPFGWMADRYSRAGLTLISVMGMAVAVAWFGFSTLFWHVLVVFAAMAVMEAIFLPTTSAMALEGGRSFGMGSTMGVFNTAMNVGMFFGAILAGYLVDQFDFAAAFLMLGAAVAVGGLMSWPMMRIRGGRSGEPVAGVAGGGGGPGTGG